MGFSDFELASLGDIVLLLEVGGALSVDEAVSSSFFTSAFLESIKHRKQGCVQELKNLFWGSVVYFHPCHYGFASFTQVWQ